MKKFFILALVLAMVAIMAVPMAVAGGSTTAVNGTVVAPSVAFTAPSAVNFGNFVAGWNNASSAADGSVTVTPGSDGNIGWSVTAKDTNVTSAGYMGDGAGHWLTNPLSIQIGDNEGNSGYLAATPPGVTRSGTTVSDALRLDAAQNIVAGDTVAAIYSITITFSASVTP